MPRLDQYPAAAALTGAETFAAAQAGATVSPTVTQVLAFASRAGGKTLAGAGDSITAGGSGGSAVSFAARAATYLGIGFTNKGTGGARMCKDGSANDAASFVAKAQAGEFDGFDIVTVAYGTNDAGNSLPIGTLDDGNDQTFYGAMGLGVTAILATNPAARIIFIAPIYRHPDTAVGPYRDAIVAFCASRNLPCLRPDLTLGINAATHATYLADTLHPTEAGADLYARFVAGQIGSIW